MKIIIFRHGIALDRAEAQAMGLSDAERPLTDRGRRRTRTAAAGLRNVLDGEHVDTIATSTLLRARQTAQILEDYLTPADSVETDALAPDAGAEAIDNWLHSRRGEERLVLVGHEPDLSTWVAWSLTRKTERIIGLKKASACLVEFPGPAEGGTGTLHWLLVAKQLRALG